MRVNKALAVQRLTNAGYPNVAETLHNFRNKIGNNWGWDGWFRGQFPQFVHIVC